MCRKFVAENCSVNEKLSMSVISKMGKGLVCITNNGDSAEQYSSLMEDEFNHVCEKQPLLTGDDLTRSGDLMAVKLNKSRAEEEGWFRAVPHMQGWALADEGFVVAPSDVQKIVTCPPSHADIPFFTCLFTHDFKNFEVSIKKIIFINLTLVIGKQPIIIQRDVSVISFRLLTRRKV